MPAQPIVHAVPFRQDTSSRSDTITKWRPQAIALTRRSPSFLTASPQPRQRRRKVGGVLVVFRCRTPVNGPVIGPNHRGRLSQVDSVTRHPVGVATIAYSHRARGITGTLTSKAYRVPGSPSATRVKEKQSLPGRRFTPNEVAPTEPDYALTIASYTTVGVAAISMLPTASGGFTN